MMQHPEHFTRSKCGIIYYNRYNFLVQQDIFMTKFKMMDESPLFYYFAYGYNLNPAFLKERLKNGTWNHDGLHKTGLLDGPDPIDLGTYVLPDYQFSYDLDLQNYKEKGSVGNVTISPNHKVYGALYRLTETQLKKLDRSEEVPRIYDRVLVQVYKEGAIHSKVDAWLDLGHPQAVTSTPHPLSDYVDTIVTAAENRHFPQDYIDKYLRFPVNVRK